MQHTMNVPHQAPVESLLDLKFHQVAIYHHNPEQAILWWSNLGFGNWHRDHAILQGLEDGLESQKSATMVFNYDIMPLELEYVSYHGPRNQHDPRDGSQPFISHLSTIVDDVDQKAYELTITLGRAPYHRFVTGKHTNPNVVGKKRFREAIFDTASLFGFDIKLIQRVPWSYDGES